MKKVYLFLSLIAVFAFITVSCDRNDSVADSLQSKKLIDKDGCVTVEPGYNEFGYNYQAHMYNGDFGYPGWKLVMKWNDAWLSNKDCGTQSGAWGNQPYSDPFTPDGKLDRHYPLDGYIGSGAWTTNHWTYVYTDSEGNDCEYSEFMKIVAAPEGAYAAEPTTIDPWGDPHLTYYTEDGQVLGQQIWGQFVMVQVIIDDPCGEWGGGSNYKESKPGLGNL